MSGIRRGQRLGAASQSDETRDRPGDEHLRQALGLSDPERPQPLKIATIRRDGGTQPRAALDPTTIQEYADDMTRGDQFPPGIVFHDGTNYWLARGFTRTAAAESLGWTEFEYVVKQGTRRDAVLFSVGENADHGQRRTKADKRRAVMTLLDDPEWREWSNSEIARRCHVDEKTVRNLRVSPLSSDNPKIGGNKGKKQAQKRTVQRGGTTYTMKTKKIGQARPKPQSYAPEPVRNSDDAEPVGQWQGERPAQPRGLYWEQAGEGWRSKVSADKMESSIELISNSEIEDKPAPSTAELRLRAIIEHLRVAAEGLLALGAEYEGEAQQVGDLADGLAEEWEL